LDVHSPDSFYRYTRPFGTFCGGFLEPEVADLARASHRLPVLIDMHNQRAIARNVLNAYLGAKTGPRVLAGQIRRGTGEEISAVLWSSDLRGFTERSDRLPGDGMIALLNALFDGQARPFMITAARS